MPPSSHRGGRAGGGRGRELPKVLNTEEITALMATPNLDAPTGLRDRCLLELMHRCGLRVSEACELHLRDIEWAEGRIHIRPEVGKGGIEGYVPFDDATRALLERWKGARRKYAAGSKLLFTTLQGKPVDRRCVWAMVRRRARKAGIERHVHPHMLRHTFATELMREGFNLREVQALCRHQDIRTTTIYTHLADAELAEKIRRRRSEGRP